VERLAAAGVNYELVTEDGEPVGDFAADEVAVGDLVPCHGHTFEVQTIENHTLRVRRVI
jgi:hypothetical protein